MLPQTVPLQIHRQSTLLPTFLLLLSRFLILRPRIIVLSTRALLITPAEED
jgi:hypothetical protein